MKLFLGLFIVVSMVGCGSSGSAKKAAPAAASSSLSPATQEAVQEAVLENAQVGSSPVWVSIPAVNAWQSLEDAKFSSRLKAKELSQEIARVSDQINAARQLGDNREPIVFGDYGEGLALQELNAKFAEVTGFLDEVRQGQAGLVDDLFIVEDYIDQIILYESAADATAAVQGLLSDGLNKYWLLKQIGRRASLVGRGLLEETKQPNARLKAILQLQQARLADIKDFLAPYFTEKN